MTKKINQDGYFGDKGKMKDDLIANRKTETVLNTHSMSNMVSHNTILSANGNKVDIPILRDEP